MQRAHHIHPEELMGPDLLSEILLIVSVLLAVGFLLLVTLQAF
jgi:hypothetical protein